MNLEWLKLKHKAVLTTSSPLGRLLCKQLLSTMRGRRLSGWAQVASKLPLLILWTLLVILILYVAIDTSTSQHGETRQKLFWTPAQEEPVEAEPYSGTFSSSNEPLISNPSDKNQRDRLESSNKLPPPAETPTTTRKSPASVYSRKSEIFILIVQDEDKRSKLTNSQPNKFETLYPSSASSIAPQAPLRDDQKARQPKLIIPEHIQLVIEILDYHRIGYTIGTTRYGLPEQLLLEGGNYRAERRYSVIIIDDFIKYAALNRWIRDQLDRYCNSNQIGVITYLLDNLKLDHHISKVSEVSRNTSSSDKRFGNRQGDDEINNTAGQFPLTFKQIEQNCQNLSSANCLVDYQLSDKAQMLRILKRKANFVIRGEVAGNVDNARLVTMASNHITYEPLTWARLREPSVGPSGRFAEGSSGRPDKLSNVRRRRRQTDDELVPAARTNVVTRHTDREHLNPARRHVQKRAVLPSPSEVTQEWFVGEADVAAAPDDDEHMRPLSSSNEEDYPPNPPDDHDGGAELAGVPSDDQSSDFQAADDLASRRILSMIDHGLYDGIKRVIFGLTNRHWSNRVLLLDAIEHLSSGEIMTPLDRYVQIDIDDIFVGERGTRLVPGDVEALIETQRQFSRLLDGGFKFNLGFSGKYFKRGNELEQQGDEFLVKNAHQFTWFCHFWSHSKAHLMNSSQLAAELERNLMFARDKNLTLIGHSSHQQYESQKLPPTYAVAPHHSGVYPIHEELYAAWRDILNVQVTSTEEYPHLRPASGRHGFVHKNIKVLPRQVCGLYTHTIYKRKYPGGFGRLVSSIRGGELFQTILHNPINIYMSHMSNYANDRLAPYTFNELFNFVQEHTNLRLRYASTRADSEDSLFESTGRARGRTSQESRLGPLQLANYYFDLYPGEREPLWTNACQDKRHLAIWASEKRARCQFVPKLLIVGPQKTGTSALHQFLKLNPLFGTSLMSADDFEEVQFFNDKHYFRGTDWYFSRFLASPVGAAATTTASSTFANTISRDTSSSSSSSSSSNNANNSATKAATTHGNAVVPKDWNGNDEWTEAKYYMDKSATYFDDPKAARRAAALLPQASIIILLINPAERAYSWYQHMRAHADVVANELSFDELLMAQESKLERRRRANDDEFAKSNQLYPQKWRQQIQALRNRCLHPGYYSSHLSNWLQHFASNQIIIVDGEWFKYNPIAVMNRLQVLLRVRKPVDYSHLLVYSEHKGFYCELLRGSHNANATDNSVRQHHLATRIKCLGIGKGRKYEPMSQAALSWLNEHYSSHNKQLAKLLYQIGQPLPTWLDESINRLPITSK